MRKLILQTLPAISFITALTALLGYFVKLQFLYSWGYNNNMAFPTCICFIGNSLVIWLLVDKNKI